MDFGEALRAIKSGKCVARVGWNGKGMWIAYTPGSEIPASYAKSGHAAGHVADEAFDGVVDPTIKICGHIDMRAADGSLVVGWLASQTDMLAEDWEIVK